MFFVPNWFNNLRLIGFLVFGNLIIFTSPAISRLNHKEPGATGVVTCLLFKVYIISLFPVNVTVVVVVVVVVIVVVVVLTVCFHEFVL